MVRPYLDPSLSTCPAASTHIRVPACVSSPLCVCGHVNRMRDAGAAAGASACTPCAAGSYYGSTGACMAFSFQSPEHACHQLSRSLTLSRFVVLEGGIFSSMLLSLSVLSLIHTYRSKHRERETHTQANTQTHTHKPAASRFT